MLTILVAQAENGVIGRSGDLPWRLSADLRRFKRLTMGHHVLMGRKTYESIGRPLPGRQMVVITRQPDYRAADVTVVHSLEEAFQVAEQDLQPFVIGGGELYREALPHCDRLLITQVHAEIDGDTRFAWDRSQWQLLEDQWHAADDRNEFPYSFRTFERVRTDGPSLR